MTTLLRIGDSSTPPASYPPCDGWAFYIGGDTPHIWTAAEVARARRYARYLLPIFTRSDPAQASATVDAQAAIAACRKLGLPRGCLVAWDLEAAVAPAYVQAVDGLITAAGWQLLLYGQLSTVTQNPKTAGGYWVGDWDGVADDPSWTGKQYTDAGPEDLSVFTATARLWDTRPAAPPTPTPIPIPQLEEDDMKIFDAPTDATEKTRAMYLVCPWGYVHIPGAPEDTGPGSYGNLVAKGVPVVVIDWPLQENLIRAAGATFVP